MLVEYYKDKDLTYASRKRYLSFSPDYKPFSTEEQKKVLLGDGATTSIKTKTENICDYVVITDKKGQQTRWFVTSYTYLNGEQVFLNLQRDVVGQYGLSNSFGKIERGYTKTILRNRKELSVNEILKKRLPLKESDIGFSQNNNDWVIEKTADNENDMWGVLYITNPQENSTDVNINIPEFSNIKYDTVDYIPEDGQELYVNAKSRRFQSFSVIFKYDVFAVEGGIIEEDVTYYGEYNINVSYDIDNSAFDINLISSGKTQAAISSLYKNKTGSACMYVNFICRDATMPTDEGSMAYFLKECVNRWVSQIATKCISGNIEYSVPIIPEITEEITDFSGRTVKLNNTSDIYYISSQEEAFSSSGTGDSADILNSVSSMVNGQYIIAPSEEEGGVYIEIYYYDAKYPEFFSVSNTITYIKKTYHRQKVEDVDVGNVHLEINSSYVDEPFTIVVTPLFSCNISYGSKTYAVDRKNAFIVFNTIISKLSGENPYLVDAQIVPYCPSLAAASFSIKNNTETKEYPYIGVKSTTYETEFSLSPDDIGVNVDVKKEYIIHKYSITSPEQSSSFEFNFYDYKLDRTDLKVKVKTSLKPFAVISSAVVLRDNSTEEGITPLMGVNYESDLKGSQPTCNGFECSLASNAFETYKRQNSNYQQLFNLSKEELRINHETERVNEQTNAVVNVLTQTAFGAISGASIADVTFMGMNARGAGAVVGAGVAGLTTSIALAAQYEQNEKLREYEKWQQQQKFDLTIGTIKAIPNSINRISSFNEIIMRDFYYVLECFECSKEEISLVNLFLDMYGYGIGAYGNFEDFYKVGGFIRGSVITSALQVNLHNILTKELAGGVYIYDKK